jgi:PAS domain-containing protein
VRRRRGRQIVPHNRAWRRARRSSVAEMSQQDVEMILARHLASRLAVPVLLVDARGDTLFFNEPAALIFGQSFDDFEATPFEARTAVLAPRDEHGRALPVDQLPGMIAMRERRSVHAAFQMHAVDGSLHAVEATALPLESAGGHVLGAMVLVWDRDAPATGEAGP